MGPEDRIPAPQCVCASAMMELPACPSSQHTLPLDLGLGKAPPTPPWSEGPWSSGSGPPGVNGAQFQAGEWPVVS